MVETDPPGPLTLPLIKLLQEMGLFRVLVVAVGLWLKYARRHNTSSSPYQALFTEVSYCICLVVDTSTVKSCQCSHR